MGAVKAGDRVRVAIPRNQPCALHSVEMIPIEPSTGTVNRIDDCLGVHSVVVVFDLRHLGTQWIDRFLPSESVPGCAGQSSQWRPPVVVTKVRPSRHGVHFLATVRSWEASGRPAMPEFGPDDERRPCDGSLHISGTPCHLKIVTRQPADGPGMPWIEHVEATPYETSGD